MTRSTWWRTGVIALLRGGIMWPGLKQLDQIGGVRGSSFHALLGSGGGGGTVRSSYLNSKLLTI